VFYWYGDAIVGELLWVRNKFSLIVLHNFGTTGIRYKY